MEKQSRHHSGNSIRLEMLPARILGTKGPLVIQLHWLGGSARTWTEVSEALAPRGFRTAAIDLPGFGDAAAISGYTVTAMADQVVATILSLRQHDAPTEAWFLAGHSMGGKLAAVIARRALTTPGLEGLSGLLLVSPSPPSPEPMKDSTRASMLQPLGEPTNDPAEDRKRITAFGIKFVADNIGKLTLPDAIHSRTVDDVLRMNRAAFRAWLESGSNEDWSTFVGILPIPALILAGTEEPALGPDAQREHTLPHFASAEILPLARAGHLGPLERPAEIAAAFLTFATSLGIAPTPEPAPLSPAFADLLHSTHTAPQTRSVMLQRLDLTPTPVPARLRALVETVIPAASFDLASATQQSLAESPGEGWRFAALPTRLAAWQRGLDTLDAAAHHHHGVTFLALDPARREALLTLAAEGQLHRTLLATLGLGDDTFSAADLKLWFEDVRATLVRLYIAHPHTMDRLHFHGFADDPHGFTNITLGTRNQPQP